jgi:hypothetical protein
MTRAHYFEQRPTTLEQYCTYLDALMDAILTMTEYDVIVIY